MIQKKHQEAVFVHVILPVAIEKPYTYSVPEGLQDQLEFGRRVEVQFGRSKRYAAIITEIVTETPKYQTKSIIDVIDDKPVVTQKQYAFWQWLAGYYCCTIGEVMHAALPSGLKLSSETVIYILPDQPDQGEQLGDNAFLILEALQNRNEMTLAEVKQLTRASSILPIIHQLFRSGHIGVQEHLNEKYRPKVNTYISLTEGFLEDEESVHLALDLTTNAPKQTQALLAYLQLSRQHPLVLKSELVTKADVTSAVINALVKKEIFEVQRYAVNRIPLQISDELENVQLTDVQNTALDEILQSWQTKRAVLLHGATGSGKTWIYKKILQDGLVNGEQMLYMLPEIALTVQVVQRLQESFGNQIVVAHSGLNDNERVDLWKRVQEGAPLILGVRSSIFLPYQNLKTIIIDEEHDASYKQSDPAPRYQGRDAAIYLATLFDARVLLGSATPSVESYFNATMDKYGLVKLSERYQDVRFPELHFVDLKKHRLSKDAQFSQQLIDGIAETLARNEQVIVFKNRRGYAPTVRCQVCGWQALCDRCDIGLTYHKYRNNLHCHLCGLQKHIPIACPECGSSDIRLEGHGTQKIEDELKILFEDAAIKRMDYDTTRRKNAYEGLITAFERQEVGILVGTQMVTKGLDFDHVGLVGVLHADQQLYFPNFRSVERTFQLLVQVSGRAGRKHTAGKVIIQTYNPGHPVFTDVAMNDFVAFYQREITSRQHWVYPPFVHLIKITLKHKVKATVQNAARLLAHRLKAAYGKRILGPAEPGIARVRDQYLMDIGIKVERKPHFSAEVKAFVRTVIAELKKEKGMTTVRVNIDVDP